MKKNKKIALILSLVLTVAMIAGATFAWFTAEDSVLNRFRTRRSPDEDVKIQEIFDPPILTPGQDATKEVSVVNTGEGPALVRLSFDEVLELTANWDLVSTPFSANDKTAGKYPYVFNEAPYTNANGWFEVTTTADAVNLDGLKLAAALPSDIKVFAKMVKSDDIIPIVTYSWVVWSEISGTDGVTYTNYDGSEFSFDGQAQAVRYADGSIDNKELTITGIEYMVFDKKSKYDASWTILADLGLISAPDIATKTSDIITETKANAAFPGMYPNYIQLHYGDLTDDLTGGGTGKWFFNEDDGWFYYLGMLEAGTSTSNLLKSVSLDEDAKKEYSDLLFDLIVKMLAIQNTGDAIIANFDLPQPDDMDNPASWTSQEALFMALLQFCER